MPRQPIDTEDPGENASTAPLTEPPLWCLRRTPEKAYAELAASPLADEVPELVIRLLAQREMTTEDEARAFLSPKLANLSDPFLIPGMEAATERLFSAIDAKEKIVLYGDYDVDGVTSVTLMRTTLAAYGLEAEAFLPHRLKEGYGISRDGLEACIEEHSPTLLVAIDCGTNSKEHIAWLKKAGCDCVVLDHHEPDPEGAAEPVALVNPKCGEGTFGYLCSAGVVFKVAHALLKKRKPEGFDLRGYIDMVAVGTVADVVPLVGENRILVHRGLAQLNHTTNPGLAALKQVSQVPNRAVASHIGFRIGPRLNAAGRIDSAKVALKLLLTDDPGSAEPIAQTLDDNNTERRALERSILVEAEQQVAEIYGGKACASIIVAGDGWHPGVVGIVASRIMRTYHRPTIVIGFDDDGRGKGSGRGISGINLFHAVNACDELLEAGGGHAQAVGLTLKKENLDAFRSAMEEAIAGQAEAAPGVLTPRITLDAEVPLEALDLAFLDRYEQLEPFGMGNPQPRILCRGVEPVGQRWLKEKHLKLQLQKGGPPVEAIWFNAPHDLPPSPWDMACTVERNEYRGRVSLQLNVRAVRAAEEGALPCYPPA